MTSTTTVYRFSQILNVPELTKVNLELRTPTHNFVARVEQYLD